MKNHIRHFAYLMNLFILIICFTACQEDENILQPETNSILEETQKTTTINYEEIQNDQLFQDLITRRGLRSYFDISSELSNPKNNNELGFIIKSTEAVKIVKDNYTSYTLSVRRKKESLYDIDNLVIGQKDGETKTYLYTYHFTQESFQAYIAGEPLTEDLKYTLQELSSERTILSTSEGTISLKKDATIHKDITVKNSGCTTVFISVPRYCHCKGHSPWDSCSCSPRSGWDTTSIRVCGDSSGGDGPLTTGYTYENQRVSAGGSAIPSFDPLDPGDGGMTTTIFATAEEFTLDNLHQRVRFSSAQLNWFLEGNNINYAPLFASFNFENNWSQESKLATKATTDLLRIGKLSGPYDQAYYQALNQYFNVDTTDPAFAFRLSAQIAVVKWQHKDDNWSDARIYATALWQLFKEPTHLLLDVGGLIPIVGEIADLANGAIYLMEGDQLNAGLSFAGAVPFAGWAATGAKLVGKVVITAGGVKAIKVIAQGTEQVAALANKLKDKFTIVIQNGVSILKDKFGNIVSQGNDVGRVVGNLADAINDAQRNVMNQWSNNIATATNKQKGNFGEIGADLDLAEKGYIPLQTRIDDINASGHNGLDGVYEKNGQFFIVEGKYTGSASLNPANSNTGLARQMSDDWIRTRDWSDINLDQNIIDNLLETRNYQRVLAKVAPDGSVTYKLVDADGYVITGNTGIFNP